MRLAAGRRFNALAPRAPRGHAEIKTLSNASAGLAPPPLFCIMHPRVQGCWNCAPPRLHFYYSLVWLLTGIAHGCWWKTTTQCASIIFELFSLSFIFCKLTERQETTNISVCIASGIYKFIYALSNWEYQSQCIILIKLSLLREISGTFFLQILTISFNKKGGEHYQEVNKNRVAFSVALK